MQQTIAVSRALPDTRIVSLVDRIDRLVTREVVTVRDMLSCFGRTSFLPALLLPALLVVSPLSGIPLLSSVCGVAIGITALQVIAGRSHLWLPGVVMEFGVGGQRLAGATSAVRRLVRWLDRMAQNRLGILVAPPADRIAFFLVALCGFAMPFLEFVPLSSSMLALTVLFLVTAQLTGDGLLVILGLVPMTVAALILSGLVLAVV